MIKFFTTTIRFMVALMVTPSIIVFSVSVLLLETILVLVSFPLAAVLMRRDDIRRSWLGSYPNSSHLMGKGLRNLWHWVFEEEVRQKVPRRWSIILLGLIVRFSIGIIAAIIWWGIGLLLDGYLNGYLIRYYEVDLPWISVPIYISVPILGFLCGLIRGEIIED